MERRKRALRSTYAREFQGDVLHVSSNWKSVNCAAADMRRTRENVSFKTPVCSAESQLGSRTARVEPVERKEDQKTQFSSHNLFLSMVVISFSLVYDDWLQALIRLSVS